MHGVVNKLSQKRKFSTGEQFSHAEISIKIFKRKEIEKTIETVDAAVVIKVSGYFVLSLLLLLLLVFVYATNFHTAR